MQWISVDVNDRPRERETVLFWEDDGAEGIVHLGGYIEEKDCFWCYEDSEYVYNVTHFCYVTKPGKSVIAGAEIERNGELYTCNECGEKYHEYPEDGSCTVCPGGTVDRWKSDEDDKRPSDSIPF